MRLKNWSKVVDDTTQLQYEKENGDFIVANKQPTGEWKIIVRDTLGRQPLGVKPTKSAAKDRMLTYIQSNQAMTGSSSGLNDDLFENDIDFGL